jgi:hypothetical protein
LNTKGRPDGRHERKQKGIEMVNVVLKHVFKKDPVVFEGGWFERRTKRGAYVFKEQSDWVLDPETDTYTYRDWEIEGDGVFWMLSGIGHPLAFFGSFREAAWCAMRRDREIMESR